ncbi:MAG: tetratricopeptide repeat protein [Candidatus Methanomethyliaceae archaeon]
METLESIRHAIATRQWEKAAKLATESLQQVSFPREVILEIMRGCGEEKLYSAFLPLAEYLTRVDPYNPSYWYNLGLINRKLQDFAGAREAQKIALQIDPQHKRARIELKTKIPRDERIVQQALMNVAATSSLLSSAGMPSEQFSSKEVLLPHEPFSPNEFNNEESRRRSSFSSWVLMGAILMGVLWVAVGLLVGIQRYIQVQKQKEEERAYKESAAHALEALEKLEDGLKIGYSYVEFSTRLADANHPFEELRRKYEGTPWIQHPSFQNISEAKNYYEESLKVWKAKIEAKSFLFMEEMEATYERKMQGLWGLASLKIEAARQALEGEE